MSGYVKIYGSILGSSVWAETPATRIVWITMLALADGAGKVEASVSGLARFANVTTAQCRSALEALSSPDTDSKSEEWDGRRVEKVGGGWLILNYLKYREMRSPKQVADAERKQRWRDGQRDNGDTSQTSTEVAATVDEAVAVESSSSSSSRETLLSVVPNRRAWEGELSMSQDGARGAAYRATDEQVETACRDYLGNGAASKPNMAQFRAYLKRAVAGERTEAPRRGGVGQRTVDNGMEALRDVE